MSSAPFWIQALKDALYLLLLILLVPSVQFTTNWREWIFLPLAVALVVACLIHAPHTGLKDQVWQNIKNVAIFIPIYHCSFWMIQNQRYRLRRGIFGVLLTASVIQCIFSFGYYYSGNSLWDDGVLAGLIGNPNSFSLILNLAFCVIVAFIPTMSRPIFLASLGFVLLIFVTMLYTFSGSQSAIFVFVLIYGTLLARRKWLRFLAVAVVVVAVALSNQVATDSTLFTMSGIPDALKASPAELKTPVTGELDNVSGSVTARVWIVRLSMSVFENPLDTIFGSFSTRSFTPLDGQFFVFLYNGGLLLLLSFAIAICYVYVATLRDAWRSRSESLVALHLMVAAFGITFVASRVLMYFPFNFIFFLICGLALTSNHGMLQPVASQRRHHGAEPLGPWARD